MRLWVIRHAEAVRSSRLDDAERPLSANGRKQAERLAHYLARRTTNGLIMTSPILRARSTAEAIHAAQPASTLRTVEALSTSGSAREVIDELRRSAPNDVVLVSHEPLTSQLVARLAAGDDHLRIQFSPATAVLLELSEPLRTGAALVVECLSTETLQHIVEHQGP